jgi:hypothetical protein
MTMPAARDGLVLVWPFKQPGREGVSPSVSRRAILRGVVSRLADAQPFVRTASSGRHLPALNRGVPGLRSDRDSAPCSMPSARARGDTEGIDDSFQRLRRGGDAGRRAGDGV